MRIGVIGLGSMGKRRIRLIKQYNPDFEIVGMDISQERRLNCQKEYGIDTFQSLSHTLKHIDLNCVFVCTAPLSHNEIIREALNRGLHVFTELNLVSDGYEENIALSEKNGLNLFLSSTFLYREEIKKIKALTKEADCLLTYTYHVGQYLPDWHPWENYKDFFVNDKRTNGCRELFAIELPWLIDVFGEVANIKVSSNKISSLKLDYDDSYIVMIEHKDGHKGTLAVDIVSRKAVRNLEVFGEEVHINWDGSPTGLHLYDFEEKRDINIDLYEEIDQLENYSSFVVENAYLNEISAFFDAIDNKKEPIYNFEKDREILNLIDRIEGKDEN